MTGYVVRKMATGSASLFGMLAVTAGSGARDDGVEISVMARWTWWRVKRLRRGLSGWGLGVFGVEGVQIAQNALALSCYGGGK